ncbi:hypothetical protein BDN71DRAFT_1431533 [Pleurotus eryngii]|uniref:DUF6533 domain-containing protein n=1 Tax=Pleurotus eryngii TaxID=5323 RepID=A0A9P6D6L3_PLEER|nr:hypothetical protein BDN71DRAFT_1431533 [Pleurotus eryngii]
MNSTASTASLATRTVIHSIDPSLVPLIFSQLRFAECFQVAIVTVLIYDALSTLDKEVKYFWSTPRRFVSLIYFANRYIGIFSAIVYLWYNTYRVTKTLCQFTLYTAVASNWITINLIDYILVMRVLALFSNDRMTKICLRILFVIEAAAMFGVLTYVQVYNGTALGEFGTNYTVCQSIRGVQPVFFILAWAIPLSFECVLLVLALYKAAEFWNLSQGLTGFHLVKVLVIDQAFYFAVAIFCNVGMIISNTTSDPRVISKVILGIMGSPSLLVILGARLLVHLKEAGEKGVNGGTSYRMGEAGGISEINFGENVAAARRRGESSSISEESEV